MGSGGIWESLNIDAPPLANVSPSPRRMEKKFVFVRKFVAFSFASSAGKREKGRFVLPFSSPGNKGGGRASKVHHSPPPSPSLLLPCANFLSSLSISGKQRECLPRFLQKKEKKLLEKKLNVSKGEKHDSPRCFLAPVGKRSRGDVGRTYNLRTSSYTALEKPTVGNFSGKAEAAAADVRRFFSPSPYPPPSPSEERGSQNDTLGWVGGICGRGVGRQGGEPLLARQGGDQNFSSGGG